jgi:hypothetical protein
MESDLTDLSASTLRTLLITEIRLFINCLDNGNAVELQAKKDHLKNILEQLAQKEHIEMAPLNWGKNTHGRTVEPPDGGAKPIDDLPGGAMPLPAAASENNPEVV